jgi:hypothetical protein
MLDICEVLNTLSMQRPLFHSEADFQHAFAWELQHRLPGAAIRLELPIRVAGKAIHIDIWLVQNQLVLAIELKYKTRKFAVQMTDEEYTLTNHSAQDFGRYDFIKDIERLERITATQSTITGYAVLLTNDSSYWTRQRDPSPVDAAFRLEENRILTGELRWDTVASPGTTRGRESPLALRGKYEVHWYPYSQFGTANYHAFRYTVVCIR